MIRQTIIISLLAFQCALADDFPHCNHDEVVDVADEEHWTARRLKLLNDDGTPLLSHNLSRQEMRQEFANRGVQFMADTHRRKLKSDDHLDQIRQAGWRPMQISYVRVGWGSDPAMTQEKVALLEKVMDDSVAILKNALSVRINSAPLRVSRDCLSFFGDGKCAALEENEYCGRILGDANVAIPQYMYDEAEECLSPSNCKTIPAGSGMANSDFVLYVTANHTQTCEGGTLAYALSCKHDEIERPIMGRTNFCPTKISPTGVKKATNTAVHEILHALGFSASYFWRWRDPETLEPLTPRNADGYPSGDNTASCNYRNVYFPGDKIAQTFAERGMRTCDTKQSRFDANNCITKVVTPLSVRAARWFSDCDTLQGIELENQAPGSCHNTGSHMEQRIWDDNIMTPLLGKHAGMSAPVLAMMQDSGWFRANWTAQDTYEKHGDWSFKQGCGFFKDERCIGENGVLPESSEGRYCTFKNNQQCNYNHRAMSYCNLQTYNGALPPQFRYFGDSRLGGISYVDYCPMIVSYSNGDCNVASNGVKDVATGQEYADGAKCFVTTLMRDDKGFFPSDPAPRCMKATCNKQADGSFTVTIQLYTEKTGEPPTVTCTQAGTVNGPQGYAGTIECPDPKHVCFEVSDIWIPGPNATDPIPPAPSPSATPSTSTIPLPSATASPTSAPGCTHMGAAGATVSPSTAATPDNTPDSTPDKKPSSAATPLSTPGASLSSAPTQKTTPDASLSSAPTPTSTPDVSSSSAATPDNTPDAPPSASSTPDTKNPVDKEPSKAPSATPTVSASNSPMPTKSATPPPTVSSTPSLTAGASPSSTPAPPPVVKAEVVINDVTCDASLTRAALTDILVTAVANVAEVLPSRVAVNITSGCDDAGRARSLQAAQANAVTADVEISGNDDMTAATSTATSLESNVQDGSLVTEMQAVAPPAASQRLRQARATASVEIEQPSAQPGLVPDEAPASSDEESSGIGTAIVVIIVGAVVVMIAAVVLYRTCRKKRTQARKVEAAPAES